MYLSCGTRPDIAFVVGQLSKQNANPRVGHLKVAKKVVRYLKDIMYLGLTYRAHLKCKEEEKARSKAPISQSIFSVIWYVDNNYVVNLKDRKLVIGHGFFIYGAIVSWYSKKQKTVSNFTIKAKYIALGNVVQKSV